MRSMTVGLNPASRSRCHLRSAESARWTVSLPPAHDLAHAFRLAGVDPEAVLAVAGVQLQVVRPVVEPLHRLAARGALQRVLGLQELDRARQRFGVLRRRLLELLQGEEVEPSAVTAGALGDGNVVDVFRPQFDAIARACQRHVLSSHYSYVWPYSPRRSS